MNEVVQIFAVVWLYTGIALFGVQILNDKDTRTKFYAAAHLVVVAAVYVFGWPFVMGGFVLSKIPWGRR